MMVSHRSCCKFSFSFVVWLRNKSWPADSLRRRRFVVSLFRGYMRDTNESSDAFRIAAFWLHEA